MDDLNTEWQQRLAEAQQRARASGRGDVADYLNLRAANDLARTTGVEWLIETFMALAGEANRAGAGIGFTRDEPHRFRVGQSTMVGARLTLRAGVRALTVEAGWPRVPGDGIVRGGGLASARIGHFGNRKADQDFLLVQATGGAPQWFVLDESTRARTQLLEDHLRRHITKLLNLN